MGEAKFTKGGWKVTGGHYPSIIEIKCGECMRISVVIYATDITYEQSSEREANAHLIAAAPEMYKEIENDIRMLEGFTSLNDGSYEYEEAKKDLDRKRHLLAKARGEYE